MTQAALQHRICVGVDGCRAGWLAVWSAPMCRPATLGCAVFPSVAQLWARLGTFATVVSIDMPIGLPARGERNRACDLAARKCLGRGAGSRVFPVPARTAVAAACAGASFAEGLRLNRAATGVGLSQQAWNIAPKIGELDALLQMETRAKAIFREAHPELAFAQLAGGQTILENKKTRAGRQRRWQALTDRRPALTNLAQCLAKRRPAGAALDDLLDALALLWRCLDDDAAPLNSDPDCDAVGLPRQIWR